MLRIENEGGERVYCPACLHKNPKEVEKCKDCGAGFTPQLRGEILRVNRKDRLIWLGLFIALCVPFFVSFAYLARSKPLFARDWTVLLLLCPICAVLMIWPRYLADRLTSRGREMNPAQVEYRAGTRMNLALAARYTGLFLYAVNAVSLVLRVIF